MGLFGNFEKKTGVKMDKVFQLANSLQNANLQDEKTLRHVIKEVSTLANKPVSKETEEKIVQTILSGNGPKDLSEITKMMGDNKK
ncbi:stage VI sporulation protein F [Bacillus solimangrovi]|uniref:stage VI sporulation protein F n=1 Tax=Bacillus solimangrovi TaxID=1305675 RepID=UPI0024807A87|nr:stage VI sporulation protein F [Bacillus solimangrovi]